MEELQIQREVEVGGAEKSKGEIFVKQRIIKWMSFIGVHARLGYGLHEEDKDARRFDLKRAGLDLDRMAQCFANHLNPQLDINSTNIQIRRPVFLATDTPAFREAFGTQLGTEVSALKAVTPRHVRELGHAQTGALLDTFAELYLLSWSDVVVHLPSGFADLAVWMGAIEKQVVVEREECASRFGVVKVKDEEERQRSEDE